MVRQKITIKENSIEKTSSKCYYTIDSITFYRDARLYESALEFLVDYKV